MKVFSTVFLVLSLVAASAQKKAITPADYDTWTEISEPKCAADGTWVSWQMGPAVGDGRLYLMNTESGAKDSIARGESVQFSSAGGFAAFHVTAEYKKVRDLKLKGKKSDDLPKDSLGIYRFSDGKVMKYAMLKQLEVCDECGWMAFVQDKKAATGKKKKKARKTKTSSEGHHLTIFRPADSRYFVFDGVTDISLSCETGMVAYITHSKKDTVNTYRLWVFDPQTEEKTELTRSSYPLKKLTISPKNAHVAVLLSTDTAKKKIYALEVFVNDGTRHVVAPGKAGKSADLAASEYRSLQFSEDERKVYFGLAPYPYNPPKDTLLDTEKPRLDVWNWSDNRIQPEQLAQVKSDEKKSWLSVLHLSNGKAVQLAGESLPDARPKLKGNGKYVVASTDLPYEAERTWQYPWRRDYYRVDTETGDAELLVQGNAHGVSISPVGNYVVWYDGDDSTWFGKAAADVGNARGIPILKDIGQSLSEWNNGSPYVAEGLGVEGWSEDELYVVIRGEFDLWACSPTAQFPCRCITGHAGVKDSVRYRWVDMDEENEYFKLDSTLILQGFSKKTKESGFYRVNNFMDEQPPVVLMQSGHNYAFVTPSKKGNAVLFRKGNYYEFPDLWYTSGSLETPKRLTNANPQQSEYAWGSVQLVKWVAPTGQPHQGLLYLPDMPVLPETTTVHPKYPMIVYFYEDYSDDIHNHYPPRPTASIVHPTEYVSNGYVVFIPDIHYLPGEPGQSAYTSIMSGTSHVLKRFGHMIDSTRMGLQGQSWGGYQTAWMITQTPRYKAAMAGAPVANMTSAYGGIRWGSGLSRMFQYERSQSRLGVTLWDSIPLYLNNSPLFFLPRVQTPLLIMHNDADDAVPWYQGIELYMGLRRLQKPVWMLTYNDDKHNLMRRANRRDLSIRMMQFFNHYLKDAPAPVWMEVGIPAVDKGVQLGYDLEDGK
jgi:dipeptidyl aminopeptidase/acylaminoacyl peptidase